MQIADGIISSSADYSLYRGTSKIATVQNGEFRVLGDLIAENYIVSSSVTNIEYQSLSGSTIFGDTSDDTHQFTGSLFITGSEINITSPSPQIKFTDENVSNLFHRIIGGGNAGLEIGADIGNALSSAYIRFDVGNSEKVRIIENGYVGIGTASPTYELDVVGSIGIDEYIRHNGDTNTYFRFTADTITMRAGGDDQFIQSLNAIEFPRANMKISGSSTSTGSFGMLGIGGKNPEAPIHIANDGATSGAAPVLNTKFLATNRGGGQSHIGLIFGHTQSGSIYFGDKNRADAGKMEWDNVDNNMTFYSGSTKMFEYGVGDAIRVYKQINTISSITTAGGVHVGSGGDPGNDNLFVDGYQYTLGGIHVGGTSDPGDDNLVVDGNVSGSATSTGSFGSLVIADKVQGDLTIGNDLFVTNNINVGADLTLSNDGSGQLSVGFDATYDKIRYGKDADVVHDFKGAMVEFGGDISGSANSTGSFASLSVGLSKPASAVDLQVQNKFRLSNSNGAYMDVLNNGANIIFDHWPGNFQFKQGDVEFITANQKISGSSTSTGSFGNVIATTFVGDGSKITGISNDGTSDTISGSATSTGSFGQLKVKGISISNNDGGVNNTIFGFNAATSFSANNGSNIIMGPNAADAMDGGESHNIVIGLHAMGDADEGASGGIDFNIAIGNSSLGGGVLSGTTQLYGNIAIGYQALTNTGTNGSTGQIGIGYQALENVTNANANVAIGYNSGQALTTGAHNTFLGTTTGDDMVEGSYNIAIGSDALGGAKDGTADSSQFNIFMGVNSGNGAWVTAVSQYNIGIGHYTLDAAMNGALNNTAVGHKALSAITTGDDNVAMGYEAGTAITTGGQNTIIGNNAGDALTTMSNCILIGHNAGTAISNNVANGTTIVGRDAGERLTNGVANSALGYSALTGNHQGGYNTAIGYESQRGVTDNAHNYSTSVGYRSLYAATTSDHNTALGFKAGAALTTGHSNVLLGSNAGKLSQTGLYNIAIGRDAFDAEDGNASYAIAIGLNALGGTNHDDSDYNIAIGHNAVASANTSGMSGIVIIGQTAGFAMNNAGTNYTTGIGFEVFRNLTSGQGNTAIGKHALFTEDEPDGYDPEERPDADNGENVQAYISGVLKAVHADTYIDMEDDEDYDVLVQMGVNGVRPSHIRECLAEKSGFEGDINAPGGRDALKEHLRKKCRIKPGEDKVSVVDSGGKSTELFNDQWRTAGAGQQKIATHFGKGMIDCMTKKVQK